MLRGGRIDAEPGGGFQVPQTIAGLPRNLTFFCPCAAEEAYMLAVNGSWRVWTEQEAEGSLVSNTARTN